MNQFKCLVFIFFKHYPPLFQHRLTMRVINIALLHPAGIQVLHREFCYFIVEFLRLALSAESASTAFKSSVKSQGLLHAREFLITNFYAFQSAKNSTSLILRAGLISRYLNCLFSERDNPSFIAFVFASRHAPNFFSQINFVPISQACLV